MDNCISNILDNGIKKIQFSQRMPSSITYQYDKNSSISSNQMLFKEGTNKIIDKTLSLLRGSKGECAKSVQTPNGRVEMRRTKRNQRQLSKERVMSSNSIDGQSKSKKGRSVNWEKRFEELRLKAEEAKKSLVNERKRGKELEKQFNRLNKKDQQYNELIKENQHMLKINESLYKKVEANEQIVNEQEAIIKSLQLEIKRYMGIYDNKAK